MPNWITNKVKASPEVIKGMLNSDGAVDFSVIAPFPGPNGSWEFIAGDAEEAAEIVCGIPGSDHPLIALLQSENRAKFDIKKLSDESFKQFVGMVENYRACGYIHNMHFNRAVWGTKRNACDATASPEDGTASFDTAWSCPEQLLTALSKRFPDESIEITFADEDIGSNCGTFTLKNGVVTDSDIAPEWRDMNEDQRAKWRAFACEVKGWSPDDSDE